MGWAARANPCALTPTDAERGVHLARYRRAFDRIPTRELYESWLTDAHVTDQERSFLETLLPLRLQAQGAV